MKQLPRRALYLWWARLSLVTMPVPFLVTLFFAQSPIWRTLLTTLWMALYLGMFLFYYPVKHHKLSYGTNKHSMMLHCGVFYNRIKAIEKKNIQHVSTSASPLERAMRLCSLVIWGAGGRIWVLSMDEREAHSFCRMLTKSEEGQT